jgi:hypothetical protein
MGDALIPVDLSAATGPAAARSTLTADKTTVDVGGTTTFTCTDVAAAGDAPTLTNRLTITSDQGVTRVTSAAVTVRRPVVRSLAVTFRARTASVVVGDTIDYVGAITNTGDVALENVAYETGAQYVSRTGTCAGTIARLRVSETVTVTCTHVVGRGDAPKVHKLLTAWATGVPSASASTVVDVERVRHRVDVMLRSGPKARHVIGDNVYGRKWEHTLRSHFQLGSRNGHIWHVQNDGNTTQTFVLKGGSGNDGYGVSYKRSKKNITRAVNNGTFTVRLKPGQTANISVRITKFQSGDLGTFIRLSARAEGHDIDIVDTAGIDAQIIRDV